MAPVDLTTTYIVTAGVISLTILIVYLFTKFSSRDKGNQDGVNDDGQALPAPGARAMDGPQGMRRRGPRRNRMRLNQDDSDAEEEDIFDNVPQQEGKVGAKKLKKLQEKAEKKAMREQEERDREDRKKKEKELDEERKKREEQEKEEAAIQEEEEKKRKEEQERIEHEEYLKMKEMFSVEDEGVGEEDADLNNQSILQQFINYIKETKVVMLEDLAGHFKLKTQDVIQRVQDLQAEGRLTGVIDDRGKFIYITMTELEAMARFIQQNGRVSISDLAVSSNRLINLDPDTSSLARKAAADVAQMMAVEETVST